jgi:hypothetical protein
MDWEGKSTVTPPDLMGKSMGKSPYLMGKSPYLMGKSWNIYGSFRLQFPLSATHLPSPRTPLTMMARSHIRFQHRGSDEPKKYRL